MTCFLIPNMLTLAQKWLEWPKFIWYAHVVSSPYFKCYMDISVFRNFFPHQVPQLISIIQISQKLKTSFGKIDPWPEGLHRSLNLYNMQNILNISKTGQVLKLQILCKPLGQSYFSSKMVPIIPEHYILRVTSKKSGGGTESQKFPYNH